MSDHLHKWEPAVKNQWYSGFIATSSTFGSRQAKSNETLVFERPSPTKMWTWIGKLQYVQNVLRDRIKHSHFVVARLQEVFFFRAWDIYCTLQDANDFFSSTATENICPKKDPISIKCSRILGHQCSNSLQLAEKHMQCQSLVLNKSFTIFCLAPFYFLRKLHVPFLASSYTSFYSCLHSGKQSSKHVGVEAFKNATFRMSQNCTYDAKQRYDAMCRESCEMSGG